MNNCVVTLLITYNRHPWIMFFYNWLIIIWKGRVRLKSDVQCQVSRRVSNVDGQGMGVLENWIIFMDVICVSSLTWNYLLKVYLKVLCCWARNLAELWDISFKDSKFVKWPRSFLVFIQEYVDINCIWLACFWKWTTLIG